MCSGIRCQNIDNIRTRPNKAVVLKIGSEVTFNKSMRLDFACFRSNQAENIYNSTELWRTIKRGIFISVHSLAFMAFLGNRVLTYNFVKSIYLSISQRKIELRHRINKLYHPIEMSTRWTGGLRNARNKIRTRCVMFMRCSALSINKKTANSIQMTKM